MFRRRDRPLRLNRTLLKLKCYYQAPNGGSFVIPLTGLDLLASDIETCKHVSASLGSFVIPGACPRLTGMTGRTALGTLFHSAHGHL